MKRIFLLSFIFLAWFACQTALAQAITGAVSNGTTGKPAAGIEVVLVDPMQGMAELAKTTTDQQGKFSLQAGAAQGPRLVRATRDGVNYFRMAPPGTSNITIEVYDAARKVERIEGTADVIRMQTAGSTLQIVELFAVTNASSPPRTLIGEPGFEVVLPPGAQPSGADAQGPNGQPISISPQQLAQKGHYALPYSLKPGETRFQLAYELPYSGQASFSPTLLLPWNHVVLVLPPSMTFKPRTAALYRHMDDQASGGNVQVASSVKPGQDLSFQISGSGSFPAPEEAAQSAAPDARDSRPGGGLGPPIDAPDALAKYRWMILGALAVLLAGAAYISVTRGPRPIPVAETVSKTPASAPPSTALPGTRTFAGSEGGIASDAAPRTSALLDAIKDELFQLEIERQQEVITQQDYEKQKSVLDQTLQHALARTRRNDA